MVCPYTGRKYNIGDFKSMEEAIQYAERCQYATEIRVVNEDGKVIS